MIAKKITSSLWR